MKNVIHIFGASGSGTTMARLCLSAFARVATLRPFSAAHGGTIFATAHSCGLRRSSTCGSLNAISLCHSAFVRVATLPKSADLHGGTSFATAHSCGLRRQGNIRIENNGAFATAHSCGLRQHDWRDFLTMQTFATAHSCGLRLRKSNAAHCEFAARR